MSFRTGLLQRVAAIRKNVPASLDLRQQNKLTIVVRVWHGTRIGGAGGFTDSKLELVDRPRVKQLTTREIASSGGRYEAGDLRVQHLTPSNGAGVGYTVEQLAPPIEGVAAQRTQVLYLLEGPHRGTYRRIALETTSDVSWHIVLRRTQDAPSVT